MSGSIGVSEFDRVVGLTAPGQFWTDNKDQNIDNYRGAKGAVSAVFDHTNEGLYSWLAKAKAGDRSVVAALAEKTRKALALQDR